MHRFEFQRSLALHQAVAERVRSDPAILDRVREKVDEWVARGGRSTPLLLEWRQVLAGSPEEVASFMTEESEKAAWMRSASPFAGVLEPRFREAILRRVRREYQQGS
ncbi:MAG TPA: hypothetical protein PKA88_00690 [Polyangiaceae bacterium]|nr:hypothetical protein [Polyangiaceae bacterium]HMR75565.1 hypothetical protein [Polyangiaceae bacterium]